jgi:hypothetical protein
VCCTVDCIRLSFTVSYTCITYHPSYRQIYLFSLLPSLFPSFLPSPPLPPSFLFALVCTRTYIHPSLRTAPCHIALYCIAPYRTVLTVRTYHTVPYRAVLTVRASCPLSSSSLKSRDRLTPLSTEVRTFVLITYSDEVFFDVRCL